MPEENRNTELLFRLDEKVNEVLRHLGKQDIAIASIETASNLAHADFDKRIKALENFRWYFLGVAAAAGIAYGVIKDWVMGR